MFKNYKIQMTRDRRLYAADDQGLISYVHFFDDAVKEIVFSANHKAF